MLKTCRAATGESSSCSTLVVRLDAGLTLRLNNIAGNTSSSLSLHMLAGAACCCCGPAAGLKLHMSTLLYRVKNTP
jgi:hypothetical protein